MSLSAEPLGTGGDPGGIAGSMSWEFWGRDPPGRTPGPGWTSALCRVLSGPLHRPWEGLGRGGAGLAPSLEGRVHGPGAGVVQDRGAGAWGEIMFPLRGELAAAGTGG